MPSYAGTSEKGLEQLLAKGKEGGGNHLVGRALNRRSEADSEGALAYYAFKKGLGENLARKVEPPADLTDEQILHALEKGADWLQRTSTRLRSLRQIFSSGPGKRSQDLSGRWRLGGGCRRGDAAAISFAPQGKEMVGRGGQTSTQIVVLTDPPQSYTIVPLGVSDHKDSGHWDDQADKLFSRSRAAPTYFLNRAELVKHVTATKRLSCD